MTELVWTLALNLVSRCFVFCGNKNYLNELSQCWVLSTDSCRNHHLSLLAWLSVTAEMPQHLASCLLVVFGRLARLRPLTACLWRCPKLSRFQHHESALLLMCKQLLVFQRLLRMNRAYVRNVGLITRTQKHTGKSTHIMQSSVS